MSLIAHASPIEHGILLGIGLGAVGGYALGWWRSGRLSPWRLAAWGAGITALLVSLVPTMEEWAQRSFAGHMVQHLLMIVVAAPLLVVARPVEAGRALQHRRRPPTSNERAVGRWWRRNGAVASAACFVAVLYLTHLTSIHDEALSNRMVHEVEHVAYLASAVGLWAALRGSARSAATARIGAVFAVIAGTALLGVVLLSASSPLVPTYEAVRGTDGALGDQRAAASLMWVAGMATTLPLLIVAVWSWASAEQRVAERSEALIDRRVTVEVPRTRPSRTDDLVNSSRTERQSRSRDRWG